MPVAAILVAGIRLCFLDLRLPAGAAKATGSRLASPWSYSTGLTTSQLANHGLKS